MYEPTPEPEVVAPMKKGYGAPACPSCGYKCGCCCSCPCQTPCPVSGTTECDCEDVCHGGHEPWDCGYWVTRIEWAKAKAARQLDEEKMRPKVIDLTNGPNYSTGDCDICLEKATAVVRIVDVPEPYNICVDCWYVREQKRGKAN